MPLFFFVVFFFVFVFVCLNRMTENSGSAMFPSCTEIRCENFTEGETKTKRRMNVRRRKRKRDRG